MTSSIVSYPIAFYSHKRACTLKKKGDTGTCFCSERNLHDVEVIDEEEVPNGEYQVFELEVIWSLKTHHSVRAFTLEDAIDRLTKEFYFPHKIIDSAVVEVNLKETR